MTSLRLRFESVARRIHSRKIPKPRKPPRPAAPPLYPDAPVPTPTSALPRGFGWLFQVIALLKMTEMLRVLLADRRWRG